MSSGYRKGFWIVLKWLRPLKKKKKIHIKSQQLKYLYSVHDIFWNGSIQNTAAL